MVWDSQASRRISRPDAAPGRGQRPTPQLLLEIIVAQDHRQMRPLPATPGQLTGIEGVFGQITERVRAPLGHRFALVLPRLSQTIQRLR
ncbi:MAG TPA: hypothetical protein VGH89_21860 [Pseudonocardia sp.]|jgi:hypothetical protein